METEIKIKKRGRKKSEDRETKINKEQSKFFVDLGKEEAVLESIKRLSAKQIIEVTAEKLRSKT